MSSLNQDFIRDHLINLAGKSNGGRVRGTPGYQKAILYLESWFSKYCQSLPIIGGFRQVFKLPLRQRPFTNLIGLIPGEQDQPFILFGAHYDANKKSPFGADDNASGVALLLDLMRHYSEAPAKYNLLFAAFDGEEFEEFGAFKGSRYFVQHSPVDINSIALANVFDLVGGAFFPGFEKTIFVFGFEHLSNWKEHPSSESLSTYYLPTSSIEAFGWLPGFHKLIGRSDYKPFRDKGVPYLFYSSGTPFYYHTPEDTLDRVSESKITQTGNWVVQLMDSFQSTARNASFQLHLSANQHHILEIKKICQLVISNQNPRFKSRSLELVSVFLNWSLRWPTGNMIRGVLTNMAFLIMLRVSRRLKAINSRIIRPFA